MKSFHFWNFEATELLSLSIWNPMQKNQNCAAQIVDQLSLVREGIFLDNGDIIVLACAQY